MDEAPEDDACVVAVIDITSPPSDARPTRPAPPAPPQIVKGSPTQRRLDLREPSTQPSIEHVHASKDSNHHNNPRATPPPPAGLSLEVLEMIAAQQAEAYAQKLKEVAEHELRLQKWADALKAKEAKLMQLEKRLNEQQNTTAAYGRETIPDGHPTDVITFTERLRLSRETMKRQGGFFNIGGSLPEEDS